MTDNSEREIKISRESIFDVGGCNACKNRPDEIYEITLRNTAFRLCDECLYEFDRLAVQKIVEGILRE